MDGIEEYMLTCVNKKIFGMECLGCGIQRATALLFKGEFIEAFKMYPAIYSLMLLLGVVVFNLFIKFRHAFKLKLALIYLNVAIIVVSYIYKMARFL
tara:strand:+ start:422 stop:712 length:291 start_codon:yes stop_codon:yes gene_type:complete